VNLKTD